MVNSLKIKKEKTEILLENTDSVNVKISYSWDEKQGIIYVKFADTGLDYQIEINTSK